MRKPADESSFFQFLHPLSIQVWLMIFAALGVISAATVMVDKLHPSSDPEVSFDWKESLWFNYGSLVQAGTEIIPRTFSGRLLACVWWFFSLIIISSYTANLAAFLTVSRINTPIDSIVELGDQKNVKYGTVKDSQIKGFFEHSKLPAFNKMWVQMSTHDEFMVQNSSAGFEMVMSQDIEYGFLWDSPVVEYTTINNCSTMQVGNPVGARGYGVGVPPGAPYTDYITMAILELKEEGKLSELDAR